MRSLSILLLFIAFSLQSFSATLKGKITDKKGESLPFAIVFLKGTTIGTSANSEGDFSLTVQDGTYTAVAQYMGYKQSSFSLKASGNEIITHNFSLEEEALEMKEFVAKATEDPALYIMRKVIARRTFHFNQIKTFQTDIYAKGIIKTRDIPKKIMGQEIKGEDMGLDSNGQGIMNQFEEEATYYSQNGKEKTVIHSVRESGDPNGLGMSQFPEVINFYKNNIDISSQITPRGMISPISDGALGYYRYKLEGDFKEGNHTIFKIRVTPKRLYEPLFNGVLYIVDNEWGIHSLKLWATAKANIQMLDTLTISQSYIPLKKDEWVIKQQTLFLAMKFLGFDLVGNIITVYDNQQINKKIADTVFNKKIISEYDKGANKKDSTYWSESRPIPLEDEEIRDYVKKDSIRLVQEDPKRLDSSRITANRIQVTDLLLSGYSYRAKENKFTLQTNAALSGLVNFNTIEGWNTAPKFRMHFKLDSFSYLSAISALRYGFSNHHFNGIARINYIKQNKEWRGRSWLVGIEGGKYVFQYNPHNPIPPLFNSISTLFYRKNYLKIYERWNGNLFVGRNFGNGLKLSGQLGFQQRIPLQNTTNFSFAKSDVGGYTDNMPDELKKYVWELHNAVIVKLLASYQPGYTYVKYPDYLMPQGSNMPVFTVSYEKGIPNFFNSKTDFDKWRFSIKDDIDLNLLGNIGYNIAVGGFFNSKYVSIPDLNHLQGNQLGIATSYLEGFQVAPYYAFSNKEPLYGEAHLEWQLRGFLTNKIPLFRRLAWYLVTGGNGYYANDNLYHAEAFVGLDNLGWDMYRFIRVDYVHGWNSLNQNINAIRIGFSTNSLINFSFGENGDTEW